MDLILTNQKSMYEFPNAFETGLSDHHKLKSTFACSISKILSKLMQDEKLGDSSDERKAHYLLEFNSDFNRCKPV